MVVDGVADTRRVIELPENAASAGMIDDPVSASQFVPVVEPALDGVGV